MTDRNFLNLTIYDLDDYLDEGYESIAIFRSPTTTGTFTEITTSATRLTLSTTETYYHYVDEGTDISNYVYKYKLEKSGTTFTDFLTPYFYGNTSDLVETLRYSIEDITSPYRYTDKELRRFINLAIHRLQLTSYKRRFTADYTGIISPRPNNQDSSIIILQALIEVNRSQITRAADTYMNFSDGRGKIEVKTALVLRTNIKDMEEERDRLIKNINKRGISPLLIDMAASSPYYDYYTG
jgi:hypothetical protein